MSLSVCTFGLSTGGVFGVVVVVVVGLGCQGAFPPGRVGRAAVAAAQDLLVVAVHARPDNQGPGGVDFPDGRDRLQLQQISLRRQTLDLPFEGVGGGACRDR